MVTNHQSPITNHQSLTVRNIKLTIVYDGSEYHGWQTQRGQKTIQGLLTEAIRELVGHKVRVVGASRTDAGVSALGQVALVQIDCSIPTENLAEAITHKLPPDIAVTQAVEVPRGFDVIGAAKSKLYRYTIYIGSVRPVLQIKHCWHLPGKLDIAAMRQAAKLLVGKKDFKSFAKASDRRENSIRTIFRCDVISSQLIRNVSGFRCQIPDDIRYTTYDIRNTQYGNDWIYIDIEGDGFLHNMVRNMVGTLVEVGAGRYRPEKIMEILEARDRRAAGPIAPAAGLCLMHIKY